MKELKYKGEKKKITDNMSGTATQRKKVTLAKKCGEMKKNIVFLR